ncbi:unknown [Clostridium clostridioforme CAG:132]|uniref:Uncharacterized protein n=1 Tax=[Clostridium] clostridioforme CAG:132 TaxID=1263065 RepID=R6JW63_9FIRM|nr:unknown [[Clostridium] clostridioforme CAG:132]
MTSKAWGASPFFRYSIAQIEVESVLCWGSSFKRLSAFSSSPSTMVMEARWDTAACQKAAAPLARTSSRSCFFCLIQPSLICWGWAGNSIANRSNKVTALDFKGMLEG